MAGSTDYNRPVGLGVGMARKIMRAARAVRRPTEAKAVYGSRLAAIVDTGKAAAAADRLDQHRVRAGPACDDIRLLRERNVAAVATCTASRTGRERNAARADARSVNRGEARHPAADTLFPHLCDAVQMRRASYREKGL